MLSECQTLAQLVFSYYTFVSKHPQVRASLTFKQLFKLMLAIQHGISLQEKNTLGLPAIAATYLELQSEQDIPDLLAYVQQHGGPTLILGGGSNLVLSEQVPGWVLQIGLRGRHYHGVHEGQHWLELAAGENWHVTVLWSIASGWPGLENLALIPGTVGAAPIQNIGAYGVELQDRFAWLRALDLQTGEILTLDKAACQFGYRDSLFKQAQGRNLIVLSVCFALPENWQANLRYAELARQFADSQPTPQQIADTVMAIRRAKLPDPAEIGNAGSFFKNPIVSAEAVNHLLMHYPNLVHYPAGQDQFKLAAGWLIEQAGWKGRQLGKAAVYHKQALVLINAGGASASDIRQLAVAIQADVLAKFGVQLEVEPIWV